MADAKSPIYLSVSSEGIEGILNTHLHQYKKELEEIERAGVPVVFLSEKPYQQAQKEANQLLDSPKLIVSNNGAYARTLAGQVVVNKKIPEDTIKAILAGFDQTGLSQDGNFSINTQNSVVNSKVKMGFWQKVKAKLSGKKVGNNLFKQAMSDAYTLNFGIIPTGVAQKAVITKNFINKKGIERKDLWKIDFSKQQQLITKALNTLITAPPALREKIEPYVDVTLTKQGISFVPKGCNKCVALEKFCNLNNLNIKNFMIQGCSYGDFLSGVPIEQLAYKKAKDEYDFKKFDLMDAFLSFAQTNSNLNIARNFQTSFLTPNNFGNVFLQSKFAELTKQENKARLKTFREKVMAGKEYEYDVKLKRKLKELESTTPKFLENGQENEEFKKKEKEFVDERNKVEKELADEVNKMDLPASSIFKESAIDGSNFILKQRLNNLQQIRFMEIKREEEKLNVEPSVVKYAKDNPKKVQKPLVEEQNL